ncbi:hypothetical protein NC653_016143 [Populus alba x Populus x berolinensis]|uniref:Reverse transcriptase zinc-binding domain-containing protein n=1 Tax=Populus alba x Populus x berolinensis TaxID=444605 RepID=A0AAD6QM61_9ROSI|nr:hypothetical protein NC653_016143 [Populus alba x Populus x berolinensis]
MYCNLNPILWYRACHSSVGMIKKGLSKQLWAVKDPPKIVNFLWRAITISLPTQVELIERKMLPDHMCTMCGCEHAGNGVANPVSLSAC